MKPVAIFMLVALLFTSCGVPRICDTKVLHTDSLITPGVHTFAYKSTQYIAGTKYNGKCFVTAINVTVSSDTFSLDTTFKSYTSQSWSGESEMGENRVTYPEIIIPCSSLVTVSTEACGTMDLD